MGGVEFKIDSINNKGQYSIDGGSTWQNFSEGGKPFAKMTVTHSGFGLTPLYCYDDDNNVIWQGSDAAGSTSTNLRIGTPACDVYFVGGGLVRFDLKTDCYIDGSLKTRNTSFTSSYMYNSGHVTEVVPVWN